MTESMLMKVMMIMPEILMMMIISAAMIVINVLIMAWRLMTGWGGRVYGRRMPRPRQLISFLSRLPRPPWHPCTT